MSDGKFIDCDQLKNHWEGTSPKRASDANRRKELLNFGAASLIIDGDDGTESQFLDLARRHDLSPFIKLNGGRSAPRVYQMAVTSYYCRQELGEHDQIYISSGWPHSEERWITWFHRSSFGGVSVTAPLMGNHQHLLQIHFTDTPIQDHVRIYERLHNLVNGKAGFTNWALDGGRNLNTSVVPVAFRPGQKFFELISEVHQLLDRVLINFAFNGK